MSEKLTTVEKIMKGLEILNKYPDCSIAAGHEEIFAGPSNADQITVDDQHALEALDWHFDEEFESWSKFV